MTVSPYSGAMIKRNAKYFLIGKAATAVLTFIILLLVVRLLPVTEYGSYVAIVAGIELAIIFSTSGLDWMAHRYIPEYRLHASGGQLRTFILRLVSCSAVALIALAIVASVGFRVWSGQGGPSFYSEVAMIVPFWLVIEGLWRLIRDAIVGPLLLQSIAQISSVLRNLAYISILVVVELDHPVSLLNVIQAEFAASTVAIVAIVFALRRHLARIDSLPGGVSWREPRLLEMARTGSHMYFARLLTLLYSPQIFLLVIQRVLGAEATAIFGFLRNLYEQVSRYLPATLLFSLVRPKLVASFVGGGGVNELTANANIAGKLSLFVLMPLVAFAAVGGQDVIGLLSGGKFAETGLLFAGFMMVLVPFSQQQLLETVAVATGQSVLCTRAALTGLAMPFILFGLISAGLGLWAPILSLGIGFLVSNGTILAGLSRGIGYRGDFMGATKLILAALAAYVGAASLPAVEPLWLQVTVQGVVAMAVYLTVGWIISPFSEIERTRLNGLGKLRWFVW